MSKTKTPNTKQAIVEVLTAASEATAAQIAVSAGVGRSTAGKMGLAQLESDGAVRRTGGRPRRQPPGHARRVVGWSASNRPVPRARARAPRHPPPSSRPAGSPSPQRAPASPRAPSSNRTSSTRSC